MSETIFTFFDTVHIHVQGSEALLLKRRSGTVAEYNLIGFKQIVTIKDFRHHGLGAVEHYLSTGETRQFPQKFNTPALTKMIVYSPYDIQIELFDTQETDPKHRLWANVGSEGLIPVYDYLYRRIQPMKNDKFAFLALYLRFPFSLQETDKADVQIF
jgi:hypothetical protein